MTRLEKYVGTYIQLNHMQSSIVKHANYDTMLHVRMYKHVIFLCRVCVGNVRDLFSSVFPVFDK